MEGSEEWFTRAMQMQTQMEMERVHTSNVMQGKRDTQAQ